MKKIFGVLVLLSILLIPSLAYADMGAPIESVKFTVVTEGLKTREGVEIPVGSECFVELMGVEHYEMNSDESVSVAVWIDSILYNVDMTWKDIKLVDPDSENATEYDLYEAYLQTKMYSLPSLNCPVVATVAEGTEFEVVKDRFESQFAYVKTVDDKDSEVEGWVMVRGNLGDDDYPTVVAITEAKEAVVYFPFHPYGADGNEKASELKIGDEMEILGKLCSNNFSNSVYLCKSEDEEFFVDDSCDLFKMKDKGNNETSIEITDPSKLVVYDEASNPVTLNVEKGTRLKVYDEVASYFYEKRVDCVEYEGKKYFIYGEFDGGDYTKFEETVSEKFGYMCISDDETDIFDSDEAEDQNAQEETVKDTEKVISERIDPSNYTKDDTGSADLPDKSYRRTVAVAVAIAAIIALIAGIIIVLLGKGKK